MVCLEAKVVVNLRVKVEWLDMVLTSSFVRRVEGNVTVIDVKKSECDVDHRMVAKMRCAVLQTAQSTAC